METPDPRKDFVRLVASAKRAGLLKALYETEGLAIIEIPVPRLNEVVDAPAVALAKEGMPSVIPKV